MFSYTLSITKALILFSVTAAIIVTTGISTTIYFQVGDSINTIQEKGIEQDFENTRKAIQTFLDYHLAVLKDHAKFSVIRQGVMQPEAMQENLIDFMSGLSMLGIQTQMALLDFKGRIIRTTRETPDFNYTKEEWISPLLQNSNTHYLGISVHNGSYFWRIAVPVSYNNQPEGILVAELPIEEVEKNLRVSGLTSGNQIELIQDGTTIVSLGPALSGKDWSFHMKTPKLTIRCRWDRTLFEQSRNQLLQQIIVGLLGTVLIFILVSVLISNRIFVRPLLLLREMAHQCTMDTESKQIPIDQNLTEISALAINFNTMMDEVNKREKALIRARETLEIKVEERTGELRKSQSALEDINNTLEQRVTERTEELNQAHSQLVIQEKMASVGQLAAGIAHELNNPINFVRTNFAALVDNVTDLTQLIEQYQSLVEEADQKQLLQRTITAIRDLEEEIDIQFLMDDMPVLFKESNIGFDRISKIILSMRKFSRSDQAGDCGMENINKGIEDTLIIARNEYKYHAELTTDLGDIPEIQCSLMQLNQVFLNLIVNSAQAIAEMKRDELGHIFIKTWFENDLVYCEFRDDGPGISAENCSRVFEPFFTTKAPGKGTGLGLGISYDIIVQKHHGQLQVKCPEAGGTVFTIILPTNAVSEEYS